MRHEQPEFVDPFSDEYVPPTEASAPTTARDRLIERLQDPELQAKGIGVVKNMGRAGLESSGVIKVNKRTGKTRISPVGAAKVAANPWVGLGKAGKGIKKEIRGTVRREAVNQALTAFDNYRQQPTESDPFSLPITASALELPTQSSAEGRGYLGFDDEPATDIYADLNPSQPPQLSPVAAEKSGRFSRLRRNKGANPAEQPTAQQTWRGFDDEPTPPQQPPQDDIYKDLRF